MTYFDTDRTAYKGMGLRFGSVCSGIEAASVAWHPLGWKAAWLAEIEPFPSAVLKHHYPEVPNLGDMTKLPERILSGEVEAPDVFCGGTPCQAFSVAGLRRSLDDARGNLSLTFCEIANAIDSIRAVRGEQPVIIFWENVPGVLSTKDNAFGCFLAGIAGEDDPLEPAGEKWTDAGFVLGPERAVAWRVLDAQHFGLAQRRKRVFVVASAREGFDPTSVLFEFDSVRRDSAPSREAGQRVAASTGAGAASRSWPAEVSSTLNTSFGDKCGQDNQHVDDDCPLFVPHATTHRMVAFGEYVDDGTASAMKARDYKDATDLIAQPVNIYGGNKRSDRPEGGFYVRTDEDTSKTLDAATGLNPTCSQGGTAVMQPVTYDFFNITAPVNRQSRTPGDPCHTLARSNAEHAVLAFHPTQDPISSENVCHSIGAGNGQGCATAAVAVGFTRCDHGGDAVIDGTPTMRCGSNYSAHLAAAIMAPAVAVGTDCYNGTITGDVAATMGTPGSSINASGPTVMQAVAFTTEQTPKFSEERALTLTKQSPTGGGQVQSVMQAMQVRRLTPVECERLQGFPDNYTAIPWRNKPAAECPDGPRYKALGNSWAVPVVRWIGQRIARIIT